MVTRKKLTDFSNQALTIAKELSCYHEVKSEELNVYLGKRLAASDDSEGIAALVELLDFQKTSSSAIKAIYECGYENPALLKPHIEKLLELLMHKKNRLVWGSMIALTCIVRADKDILWHEREKILEAYKNGSVITRDGAVEVLARMAATDKNRMKQLSPLLYNILKETAEIRLARYFELIFPALEEDYKNKASRYVSSKIDKLSANSRRKINDIIKAC